MEPRRYLGLAAGLTGAALAWLLLQFLDTLSRAIPGPGPLDLVAVGLLGLAIGGAVRLAMAHRREEPKLRATTLGAGAGAAGAAAAGVVGLVLVDVVRLGNGPTTFLLARALVWALASAGLALALAVPSLARHPAGAGRAGLAAGLAGLAAAGLVSLPLPGVVGHLVGFLLVGAVVGYVTGASRDEVWVLERLPEPGAPAGLLARREWEIGPASPASVGGAFRLDLSEQGGRVDRAPGYDGALTIDGRAVTAGAAAAPGAVIAAGPRSYRIRPTPVRP
jgi:hypothetical protein